MQTGILYIVATPIGNLEDITFRALETLRKVDLIICEDTRHTQKLLQKYEIKTPSVCFYCQSRGKCKKPPLDIKFILGELIKGKNLALVTDAGTPGISDPGNLLVEKAVDQNIAVIPIPGASALTAIASISGIDLARFTFLGFPPHKKGRETFFKEVAALRYPVIYYESPHRLIKNLELLKNLVPDKRIIIGKELTKMFEEIVRGTVTEVLNYLEKNKNKIKGEFAIIVY
jgi:16S rRNA (cytidine1402-2'-O)-methyltransferase